MRSDRVAYDVTVARWEPNARERLENAALDLFVENGFEETTVAQIADRAKMNRATFFRHFADKREVLFGGQDVLTTLFADAIKAAPPGATLTECLHAALAAAETAMTPQLRIAAVKRRSVVASNSELQERGLLKHARITAAVVAALRERGTDELTARFGAETEPGSLSAFRVCHPGRVGGFSPHLSAMSLVRVESVSGSLAFLI